MTWEYCPSCNTEAEIVTDSRGLTIGCVCPGCQQSWPVPRAGYTDKTEGDT
jgi:hypothetical protein